MSLEMAMDIIQLHHSNNVKIKLLAIQADYLVEVHCQPRYNLV